MEDSATELWREDRKERRRRLWIAGRGALLLGGNLKNDFDGERV